MSSSTGSDHSHQRGQAQQIGGRQDAPIAQEGSQSATSGDAKAAQQADALDAVLDDIETSLEQNAEEYVNGFVQKGGQ